MDLYYLHRVDRRTPIEETVKAMAVHHILASSLIEWVAWLATYLVEYHNAGRLAPRPAVSP